MGPNLLFTQSYLEGDFEFCHPIDV